MTDVVAKCPSCGGDAGDNWFDRTLCGPPCESMHTRCSNCGAALDPCPAEPGPHSSNRVCGALGIAAGDACQKPKGHEGPHEGAISAHAIPNRVGGTAKGQVYGTATGSSSVDATRNREAGYVADLQMAHDALLDLYATHEFTYPFNQFLQSQVVALMRSIRSAIEKADV